MTPYSFIPEGPCNSIFWVEADRSSKSALFLDNLVFAQLVKKFPDF